jgi:hypothetical protein
MPPLFINFEKPGIIQVQRQLHSSSRIGASAARSAIAASLLAIAACGGGSSTSTPLTLSGTISGLTTSGLGLSNNGASIQISAGATTFTCGAVLVEGLG